VCLFPRLLPAQSPGATEPPRPPAAAVFIQLFEGIRFDDTSYALNTASGHLRTILLNGDARWRYGEHTFYTRIFSGDFIDGSGATLGLHVRTYSEWTSRLSFLAMGKEDRRGKGTLRDLFVALQVNRGGTGLRANLVGLGMKLKGPGALATTTSVYYRSAPGDDPGMKIRTSWSLPITSGRLGMSFEGSEDLVTHTATGDDQNGFPALLIDVGRLFNRQASGFSAGIEWFHHQTRGTRLSAPQATVRWAF
jgi:hypothetical protein